MSFGYTLDDFEGWLEDQLEGMPDVNYRKTMINGALELIKQFHREDQE